jgi:hypothetical protein
MEIIGGYEEEKRNEIETDEWIVLSLEQVTGTSAAEMTENLRTVILELGQQLAPETFRTKRTGGTGRTISGLWFLYWWLPAILRRGLEKGRRGIWLRHYDLPLLYGLRGGFGRYSTEMVSAVAQACAEAAGEKKCLYLTTKLPFPIHRIGWTHPVGEVQNDGEREECVRSILYNAHRHLYRERGREWIACLERGIQRTRLWLSSEEIRTPGHWLALARYAGIGPEIPQLLRDFRIDAVSIR